MCPKEALTTPTKYRHLHGASFHVAALLFCENQKRPTQPHTSGVVRRPPFLRLHTYTKVSRSTVYIYTLVDDDVFESTSCRGLRQI
jgi:hypothetical protein